MIKGFLNLPWFAWAAIAILVTILFSFVWPHKAVTVTTGFRFFVLRWGHALTWLLLAINFVLRGLEPRFNGTANVMAAMGGLIYLLFMLMAFIVR